MQQKCTQNTKSARVSPETHRHCCVFVGPALGSPHVGSVPWSSPWGASTCHAPRNVLTTLDRSAAAPASFLLLQQSPLVSSISGLFFSSVFLYVCPFFYAFQSRPSSVPPSRNLFKTFPPSRSWTSTSPPPAPSLTLPPWLVAQVSIHWKMPVIPGRRTSYVFNFECVLRCAVQRLHAIMYVCNVMHAMWCSQSQENKDLHDQNTDQGQTLQ